MLPERSPAAEDQFVRIWSETEDTDGLLEVIDAAMAERRPLLAARLVNLLDDHVAIEPGSAADRARRAARMLLVRAEAQEFDAVEGAFVDLEEAWREARRDRMARIRARMRAALEGRHERQPRVHGPGRRRR